MFLELLDLDPLFRGTYGSGRSRPTHLRFIQLRSFYAGKIYLGAVLRIRIRGIRMVLDLLDLDPLVRVTDPVFDH